MEEPVPDTLVCENEAMKDVLDAFGMDIKAKRAEKGVRMGISVGKQGQDHSARGSNSDIHCNGQKGFWKKKPANIQIADCDILLT